MLTLSTSPSLPKVLETVLGCPSSLVSRTVKSKEHVLVLDYVLPKSQELKTKVGPANNFAPSSEVIYESLLKRAMD